MSQSSHPRDAFTSRLWCRVAHGTVAPAMTDDRLPATARIAAALTALVGAASLGVQPWVSALLLDVAPFSAAAFEFMSAFFTILTNLWVTLLLARVALTGRPPGPSLAAMLTLSMLMVGGVYHAVLARLWDPYGFWLWADHGLHTVMPLAVAAWWLVYAPKVPLGPVAPFAWLIWPGLYGVYGLLRGVATGWYPYPFLDVGRLGVDVVAMNVVVLGGIFLAGGYALWAVARLCAR